VHIDPRKLWRLGALTLAGAALLVACGDDDASSDPTPAAPAATAAPTAADDGYGYAVPEVTEPAAGAAVLAGAATVATAETSIGTVLVDGAGRTLYAFTEDTAGEPTCIDACAGAWPPALVDGAPAVGDLDPTLFSTVEHPEGAQLKVGDHPLYTFAGDAAAGDVNGHGSGDVWFAVAADGTLID